MQIIYPFTWKIDYNFYNPHNLKVNVNKFKTSSGEGEQIIWTLIEYIRVDMIVWM